jgi:hypothetical protein
MRSVATGGGAHVAAQPLEVWTLVCAMSMPACEENPPDRVALFGSSNHSRDRAGTDCSANSCWPALGPTAMRYARIDPAKGGPPGSGRIWPGQARDLRQLPAFVRDASPGSWLRHPYCAGTTLAQRRADDDDRHPRTESRRPGRNRARRPTSEPPTWDAMRKPDNMPPARPCPRQTVVLRGMRGWRPDVLRRRAAEKGARC